MPNRPDLKEAVADPAALMSGPVGVDAVPPGMTAEAGVDARIVELERTRRAMLNIMADLDAEKRVAEAEREKLTAVFTSLGDSIVVVDAKRQIELVNPTAESVIGLPQAELRGRDLSEVIRFETIEGRPLPKDETGIDIAMLSAEIYRTTYRYLRADGSKMVLSASAAPLIYDKKVVGGVEVWHDISKEAELDKAKSEFVMVASHQLRTPLTAINWFSEAIMDGDYGGMSPELRDPISAIAKSGHRMSRLINALLNVSRIEMGRLRINPEPCDLTEIRAEALADLKPAIEAKKISVSLNADGDPGKIGVDRNLVKIVYQNLISNAVKYAHDGGHISITITRSGDSVLTAVADDGIGIPKHQRHRIFEKLFRADNVLKVETDGTGLGLYIAKAAVEQSGGKIWFESEEGRGAKFTFSLPITGVVRREGAQSLINDV